jgi:curved DNA-binding protein CbpA
MLASSPPSKKRTEEIRLAERVLVDPKRRAASDKKHIVSDGVFEFWEDNRYALQAYKPS